MTDDPYLQRLYDSRHASTVQDKFRRLCAWPVGSVFIEHPDMTEDDIRNHFKTMRRLGFTALKQCQVCPGTDRARVMHMALDEGLIPWWYGEAGWEDPTPVLLAELGIDPDIAPEELEKHPAWTARQTRLLHERVDREAERPRKGTPHRGREPPDLVKGPDWVPSVQPTFVFDLNDEQCPLFLEWLKQQYGTIEKLNRAWNTHHCMIVGPRIRRPRPPGSPRSGWLSWDDLAVELPGIVNRELREYRRIRDVLRFKADNFINWLRDTLDSDLAQEPNAPVRAGGEMGLFLPFASRGTDMAAIADLLTTRGSFYPSIHPAWHYEEVRYETPRTFYMQASLSADWFKGGWNATWESTGGPQQLTGGKPWGVPDLPHMQAGFTIDEHTMRQLMFSWMAAGYRGFGLWCWTPRTAGWEAGEFGLCDRNGKPSPRAVIAGRIGRTCRRLRRELWAARKEPMVGVFQDFDLEAFWAAVSRNGRETFKYMPMRARVGVSRSLINANIPWEHVTAADLRAGLAPRYRTIVFPAALAVDPELLELLTCYVREGGRVVLDAPGGWYDYYGRLLSTADGSAFERLFGCRIADCQYSRANDRPWRLNGELLEGSILILEPTAAETRQSFDHAAAGEPSPAVTVHRLGGGEAVTIAYAASLMCFEPGRPATERHLASLLQGPHPAPFRCEGPAVYRLAAPKADHYFLINDGEATAVHLDTGVHTYLSVEDPVEETTLPLGKPIPLHRYSARWLRFLKDQPAD